jgi:hypothetical protein
MQYNKDTVKRESEVNKMAKVEMLKDGMFVGMNFEEVVSALYKMGFKDDDFIVCEPGDEVCTPMVQVGREYDVYFDIDFDNDVVSYSWLIDYDDYDD